MSHCKECNLKIEGRNSKRKQFCDKKCHSNYIITKGKNAK